MIYLHHTPICAITIRNTPILQKQALAHHRHQLLSQFCQYQHLPTPIYDKSIHGKPFCQNISHLSFNQSHCTSDYVLIYSLEVSDIGVDIENMGRNLNFDNLAKRYFHDDEYHHWQDNGGDKRLWFCYWTIKEAVLKACGLGIRMPLNALKAVLIDKDFGYVDNDGIGKFYFRNIVMGDGMITVAYPFEYGKIDIIVV